MGVPPTPHHENGAIMCLGRRSGNVGLLWYCESARKLTWKLSVPRIGACEPVEQSRDEQEASPSDGRRPSEEAARMEQLIERCAGLDVHKQTVTACVRVPGTARARESHVRRFGTTSADLLALRDWLETHGVTHVAMESTGVYWKPVYYILEERFTCLLVNAAHIKRVPGRKTDVQDSEWIAQLLEHGLLRGSFVPPAPIRELRDLTRYRKVLIEERTREVNRLHKVLEDAGIKLASVATRHLGRLGPRHAGGARPRHDRPGGLGGPRPEAAARQRFRRFGRRWRVASARTTRSW